MHGRFELHGLPVVHELRTAFSESAVDVKMIYLTIGSHGQNSMSMNLRCPVLELFTYNTWLYHRP